MSQVQYIEKLPAHARLRRDLSVQTIFLLADRKLRRDPQVARWARQFSNVQWLQAGENLKTMARLEQVAQVAVKATAGQAREDVAIVVLGGGSIGDFGGFLASVLKRGVKFAQIPSTWIAAMDSAHGGKNALNVGAHKNQIGLVREADKIYCVRQLLIAQPQGLADDAYGEIFKMGLVAGGGLWRKILNLKKISAREVWQLLPEIVAAKMRIVRRDPYETRGIRFYLNLGHTLGHAIELAAGLSHGRAVLKGIQFATALSESRGVLRPAIAQKILRASRLIAVDDVTLSPKVLKKALVADKKAKGGQIRFVFVRGPGKLSVQKISVDRLLKEYQEWRRT